MYWVEKIEIIKKEFNSAEFKDPFYNGNHIIKKIINKFHNVKPDDFYQIDDKENLIKNNVFIKECSVENIYKNEMEKLELNTNYYLFLIDIPMDRYKIYDCQKNALRYLLYLSSSLEKQRFYIIDKKYNWLNYFIIDKKTNKAKIYKCGNANTIFG